MAGAKVDGSVAATIDPTRVIFVDKDGDGDVDKGELVYPDNPNLDQNALFDAYTKLSDLEKSRLTPKSSPSSKPAETEAPALETAAQCAFDKATMDVINWVDNGNGKPEVGEVTVTSLRLLADQSFIDVYMKCSPKPTVVTSPAPTASAETAAPAVPTPAPAASAAPAEAPTPTTPTEPSSAAPAAVVAAPPVAPAPAAPSPAEFAAPPAATEVVAPAPQAPAVPAPAATEVVASVPQEEAKSFTSISQLILAGITVNQENGHLYTFVYDDLYKIDPETGNLIKTTGDIKVKSGMRGSADSIRFGKYSPRNPEVFGTDSLAYKSIMQLKAVKLPPFRLPAGKDLGYRSIRDISDTEQVLGNTRTGELVIVPKGTDMGYRINPEMGTLTKLSATEWDAFIKDEDAHGTAGAVINGIYKAKDEGEAFGRDSVLTRNIRRLKLAQIPEDKK